MWALYLLLGLLVGSIPTIAIYYCYDKFYRKEVIEESEVSNEVLSENKKVFTFNPEVSLENQEINDYNYSEEQPYKEITFESNPEDIQEMDSQDMSNMNTQEIPEDIINALLKEVQELIAINKSNESLRPKDTDTDDDYFFVSKVKHKETINLSVLNRNFNDLDTVDIDRLKLLGLIPEKTAIIKIIGVGALHKKLFVYANEFTEEAIKVIKANEGEAIVVEVKESLVYEQPYEEAYEEPYNQVEEVSNSPSVIEETNDTEYDLDSLVELTNDRLRFRKQEHKEIINLSVFERYFENNDVVTIQKLIDLNLIPKKTTYLKVLGKGVISKKLIVIADDFSNEAIKIIQSRNGFALKQSELEYMNRQKALQSEEVEEIDEVEDEIEELENEVIEEVEEVVTNRVEQLLIGYDYRKIINYNYKHKEIINTNVLEMIFEDNAIISITELKTFELIPEKTGFIKILGKGKLTKRFIVIADDFSMEAIRIIKAAGGEVIKTNEVKALLRNN